MSSSKLDKEIIDLILAEVKEPYVTVWSRSFVFDDGTSNYAFIQPQKNPTTYKNLTLSPVRPRMKNLLLAKQAKDNQDHGNAWTCITISIKGENEYSIELRYEDLETMDMHQLTCDWMKTAMAGLEFIPDQSYT